MSEDELEARASSQEPVLEEDVEPGAVKRKHDDEDDDAASRRREKRRRAKKARHAEARNDEDIDEELQVNRSIGRMDGALLADHLSRQTKRFEPSLSMLEMEDLRIPGSAFVDTTSWTQQRTVDKLPQFLEHFAGKSRAELSQAPTAKGSPHTLVICGAAIRAAEVSKPLRCYQTDKAKVAKLFAKHIKLKDAILTTESTRISIGVGNPQRLADLVQAGALSLAHVERIIVDGSFTGPKKRTMLEMEEVIRPMMRFLALPQIKDGYNASGGNDRSRSTIMMF